MATPPLPAGNLVGHCQRSVGATECTHRIWENLRCLVRCTSALLSQRAAKKRASLFVGHSVTGAFCRNTPSNPYGKRRPGARLPNWIAHRRYRCCRTATAENFSTAGTYYYPRKYPFVNGIKRLPRVFQRAGVCSDRRVA